MRFFGTGSRLLISVTIIYIFVYYSQHNKEFAIRQTLCGSGFQPRIQLSRLEAAPTFNTTCSFWRTTFTYLWPSASLLYHDLRAAAKL
jgi:hypothetical protein